MTRPVTEVVMKKETKDAFIISSVSSKKIGIKFFSVIETKTPFVFFYSHINFGNVYIVMIIIHVHVLGIVCGLTLLVHFFVLAPDIQIHSNASDRNTGFVQYYVFYLYKFLLFSCAISGDSCTCKIDIL